MKNVTSNLAKLIDVKSIVTILLVVTLVTVILANVTIADNVFQLFNTVLTAVVTYFFTKPAKEGVNGENTTKNI